jgi:hypothetical protein
MVRVPIGRPEWFISPTADSIYMVRVPIGTRTSLKLGFLFLQGFDFFVQAIREVAGGGGRRFGVFRQGGGHTNWGRRFGVCRQGGGHTQFYAIVGLGTISDETEELLT